jgi:hypothetical protein
MAGMAAAMDPAALQPKPAIDSGGAARNGNSGQVAPTTVQPTTVQPTTVQPTTVQPTSVQPTVQPTTVQPVQPAGATQVTPAPTQVQRTAGAGSGPSNGGAPAATQVTKQAANGKEDDEDWWTE